MGNVQGYVKVKDRDKLERHLIKLNKLYNIDLDDNWVYDFQKHEIGHCKDGMYMKQYSNYIDRNIGDCYIFKINGKVELYDQEKFLEYLKNAAVEHINNTFKIKDDDELINL